MKKDKYSTQALEYAMENELIAKKLYNTIVTMVEDDFLKNLFREFALEEGEHYKVLLKISDNYNEEDALFTPSPNDELFMREISDIPQNPQWELKEAINFALSKEKEASQLYAELSNQSKQKKLKETFLWLSEQEKLHEKHFEKIMAKIEDA